MISGIGIRNQEIGNRKQETGFSWFVVEFSLLIFFNAKIQDFNLKLKTDKLRWNYQSGDYQSGDGSVIDTSIRGRFYD